MRTRPSRTILAIAALVIALFLLASCAAGPNPATGPDKAGFWSGLWQGLIFPITFFISLFTDRVNVYEVVNNGNWYDFGFWLGIIAIGGGGIGGSRFRKRR
ncbi:MAG: hypothetical protein ACJ76P_11075 [Actinomycetota bacterium]